MKDAQHPFFRPLWRRIAIVVVCLGWAGLEFWSSQPFWGTIALGMAGYGAWSFLLNYKEPAEPAPPPDKE
jgi:hypothetical protein